MPWILWNKYHSRISTNCGVKRRAAFANTFYLGVLINSLQKLFAVCLSLTRWLHNVLKIVFSRKYIQIPLQRPDTRKFLYLFSILWGKIYDNPWKYKVRSGAVGWGTALQARMSRVRFPIKSLGFFHWFNLSGRTMVLGLTQPLTEMSTRIFCRG